MLTIKAIECQECGDVIYSRTHQDFRQCTCGSISVSGGLQYFKYDTGPASTFKIKKIQVNATITELYEDYNQMTDEYGLILSSGLTERIPVAVRS